MSTYLLDTSVIVDVLRGVRRRIEAVERLLPDCLIAAAALTHGLVLMTDNVKNFPMPGLLRHSLDVEA